MIERKRKIDKERSRNNDRETFRGLNGGTEKGRVTFRER